MDDVYSARDFVAAAYYGLLNRAPDEAAAYYEEQLRSGEVSKAQLLQFFASLTEFYAATEPQDRQQAIAALYGRGIGRGNPYTWADDTQPNVVFLHLPKTGGISFRQLITDFYHPLQIGRGPERAQGDAGRGKYQKYFGSHMSWSGFRGKPQPAIGLSAFRTPERRLASLFFFLRAIVASAEEPYKAAAKAATEGQVAFFSSNSYKVFNHVNNCYVRTLADAFAGPTGDPLDTNPELYLDIATERAISLDAYYLLEEVQDGGGRLPSRVVSLLSSHFDRPFPELLPRENVNAHAYSEILSAELIAQNCDLDNKLYRRLAAHIGFPSAVE